MVWNWASDIVTDICHLKAIQRLDESIHHVQQSKLPTVDAIVEEKRLRQAQETERQKQEYLKAQKPSSSPAAQNPAPESPSNASPEDGEAPLEDLQEEADQQGAFNPETGEINWDCPCLGGMAHGPCGEEFKAAFSCFVYSTEEPKGVECIEKFKGMQDCFRLHPEMYGSELEEDEEEVEREVLRQEEGKIGGGADSIGGQEGKSSGKKEQRAVSPPEKSNEQETRSSPKPVAAVTKKPEISTAIPTAAHEDSDVIPKASFDTTSKN